MYASVTVKINLNLFRIVWRSLRFFSKWLVHMLSPYVVNIFLNLKHVPVEKILALLEPAHIQCLLNNLFLTLYKLRF